MKQKVSLLKSVKFIACLCSLMPITAHAQNTVYFSTSDVGVTKAITDWGVDMTWASSDNMRQSLVHMGGAAQVDVVRLNFYKDEPLQSDGTLGTNSKTRIDNAISMSLQAGNKPLVLSPDSGDTTNSWYLNGTSGVQVDRWVQVIQATRQYIAQKYGKTIVAVEPFNEPDYWPGEGTPQNLNDIMTSLHNIPAFQNTILIGASTLNSDVAQSWYDQISGPATYGSTHELAGSATSYVNFIQHVQASGDKAYNPEIHSMAEAIYGAQYGLEGGIWWGAALKARGLFVQSCQGQRLGYSENLSRQTTAAVYRAPDGSIHAFAGGFERTGTSTAYRFVSTDRDVYFNGIGPIREYMVQVGQGDDAYADIQYGTNILPPLDGNRWKIVNRQTGQVMEVLNGSMTDGALIRSATDAGASALYQKWDIVRDKDGYYALFNAKSGKTADVLNGSLSNGASVDQWGTADNLIQHWLIQDAGNGYYYLRNGNSNSYLTNSTTNCYQLSTNGSYLQQWQFVLANPTPTGTLKAQYKFQGNVLDSTGLNNGVASGNPTYGNGPTTGQGQAISLNGTNAYVTLPSGVANSNDITVSEWVKWNGGSDWQRIFDFGNNTTSYMFLTPKSGYGTMRFAITTAGNGSEQILDTDPLPTGQWVHLAVTLSGNTGVLYVNGAPRVAGQILLNPSDFNPTLNYIGKSQWPDPLFSGMIDDFRIYDYALDQSQIANLVPISHYSWTGSVSTEWLTATIASPKNWKLAFDNTATDYFDSDTVLFDDSATSFTVNTASNVSPVATTFYNTITYTFTGAAGITGVGSLTKNGAGIVNINNVNTYTGATTINVGTVNLNGSLAGSAVTVNAGRLSESSTGAITGNVALTNSGYTWLAGANSLGAIRVTGPGTLSVTGGTTSTTNSGLVSVGDTTGDNALLNVTTGVLNANKTSSPSIVIGAANIAKGTMTISGGTVNAAGEVWVSSATGATGTLNVSGGTLNSASWLAIGRGGDNGNLNVTGGYVNVNGSSLTIASFGGSVGQATITGGTVTTVNNLFVGEGGSGTLLLSGSGNIVANGAEGLRVGRNSGSFGTVNLNTGGTITTTAATGGDGTSTFNFNGGTLKAKTSTTAFMENLDTVNVQSGGAIIDSNGFYVAIAQQLLAGSPSGGLTKNGSGILTLTGNPTYTGNTVINIGALQLNTGNTTLAAIYGQGELIVGNGSTATQLTVSSINVGTLTIAANSTVTISPIAGGPLAGMDPISPAPEPSTWAMLVMAAMAIGMYWRRSLYETRYRL